MGIKVQSTAEAVNSPPLQFGAGDPCVSVTVDNYSGSWLYVNPAQRYVAPFTHGAVLNFPNTTVVSTTWQTPPVPGLVAGPVPSPPGQCQLTWSDTPGTETKGLTISAPTAGAQKVFTTGAMGLTGVNGASFGPFSVPVGTRSLVCFSHGGNGQIGVNSGQVSYAIGLTSNNRYKTVGSFGVAPNQQAFVVPTPYGGNEAGYFLNIVVNNAAVGDTIDVYADPDENWEIVGNSLGVNLLNLFNGPDANGAEALTGRLNVSSQSNFAPIAIAATLPINSNVTVWIAPAVHTVDSITWTIDSATLNYYSIAVRGATVWQGLMGGFVERNLKLYERPLITNDTVVFGTQGVGGATAVRGSIGVF